MAKAKQPDNEQRPGVDYYAYKQLQETARLRRRALEANLNEARRKSEPGYKSKMRVVAKIADDAPAMDEAEDSREPVTASAAPVASEATSAPDFAEDAAQPVDSEPDVADEPGVMSYDENDVEITNPFADALGKIRMISSRLFKRRAKDEPEPEYAEDAEYAEDGDPGQDAREGGVSQETVRTKVARLKKAGQPGVTLALSEMDDDADIDRRSRRKAAAKAVLAVSNDVDDDPLGVMRPYSEDERRAYMRPSAEDDELHRSVSRAASKQQRLRDAEPQSEAALTAKLLDDLENVPALSRRERKALANAGTLSKPATRKPMAAEDDELPVAEETVDEPTQQFRPLRYRVAKTAVREVQREIEPEDESEDERIPPAHIPAPIEDDEDDYLDDEDEDDDEDDYVRQVPARRFGRKRRVYRDEEYEGDYDEDDEDDYDDEEDYDSDYDEDDEDYDDYDEEEALNDRYQISFGKRMLALIKGLLIVVLLFLLAVVALRQLETSGRLSLDFIRNTVGQMLPIEMLLPDPNAEGGANVDDVEAPLTTDLPTPEPSLEPTFEPDEPVDAEGSPLDDYADSREMQGMDDYDELEGYSDIDGGEDDFDEDFEEDYEEDDAPVTTQAHATFEQFSV